MHICLYLDPNRIFRWHGWLAETLAALPGRDVVCVLAAQGRPLPQSCSLLFELERLVYGLSGENAIDPCPEPQSAALRANAAPKMRFDLVIDLAGDGSPLPAGDRILMPSFNAVPGEIGLIKALVYEQPLLVELLDTARPDAPWTARPATADRNVLARSLDNVLSCTVRLIAKAAGVPAPAEAYFGRLDARLPSSSMAAATGAMVHATRAVLRKAIKRLDAFARGEKAWAVAWRFDTSLSLLDKKEADFAVMPDDGRRYYADPFPFHRNGQNFLFIEEFPYETQRGFISVIEFDAQGKALPPRPVLEEPHHLSYPQVFDYEGEIWMIPESGAAGNICLYRADPFPYKWTREAVLIDGIRGYDSTLMRHDGRFWLFVCESGYHSSSWDILSLFHAETLTGTWMPHAQNPVLIDAILSRPGGAIFKRDGVHLRPTQDCSEFYGGALVLSRVDSLSHDSFSQTPVGRIDCGPHGCHTYNYAAGLEVIDVFGPTRGLKVATAFFTPLAP